METIVYRLRDEYANDPAGSFVGGLIRVGDGELDIASALKKGKGKISADATDTALLTALDQYPALERDDAAPKRKTKAERDAEAAQEAEAAVIANAEQDSEFGANPDDVTPVPDGLGLAADTNPSEEN